MGRYKVFEGDKLTYAVMVQKCGAYVLGICEASGMFPIDENTIDYNADMLSSFDSLTENMPRTRLDAQDEDTEWKNINACSLVRVLPRKVCN